MERTVARAWWRRWLGRGRATGLGGWAALLLATCGTAPPVEDAASASLWLPGLTLEAVQAPLRAAGFRCGGPVGGPVARDAAGRTLVAWSCVRDAAGVRFRLEAKGAAPDRLRYVTAEALALLPPPPGGEGEALALVRDFLQFAATLPYAGADQAGARAWVSEQFPAPAEAAFGPARFTLWGEGAVRGLSVRALDAP